MTVNTLIRIVNDFCDEANNCSECPLHIYGGTTGGDHCPAEKFLGFLAFTDDRIHACGGLGAKFDFAGGVNNDV